MSFIRKIIRSTVFPVITATGMEKMLRSGASGEHLILTYHGVGHSREKFSMGRHIHSAELDGHFRYLKKNFDVLTLEEIFREKTGNTRKRKAVAITFDDGYENNLKIALPLLRKYELPATIFITSGLLTEPGFILWPYYLYIVLMYSPEKVFEFGSDRFIRQEGQLVPLHEKSQVSIIEHIKHLGEGRDTLLREFAARYHFDELKEKAGAEYYRMMSPEQLTELAASPLIEIGSHTHVHYCLANIDPELAFRELKESRDRLRAATGKPVDSIAFPDGSYTNIVKEAARKAGYTRQLAVDFRCSDDPQTPDIRPRYCISNTTTYHTNILLLNKAFKKYAF